MISLYDHQIAVLEELESGFILCGGVGSGKSRTAIAYYFRKECSGSFKINGKGVNAPMLNPKDLYIITTAKKRDTLEWEDECAAFGITRDPSASVSGKKLVIDSWNNIGKYVDVKNAFFLFDEQRLVGSGAWVKSFLKIVTHNNWLLLTATPGDTWNDYIPVFIANGFYRNRTEFLSRHAVYSRFAKFSKVDRYVETKRLTRLRDQITVIMEYEKPTRSHEIIIKVDYDVDLFKYATSKRWNPYTEKPVRAISELFYLMRKIVNSDPSRITATEEIFYKHPKLIIFYNFDYELEMLREMCKRLAVVYGEWNGHVHNPIPSGNSWIYLVQYTAGAEGWNCIDTDVTVFYSMNYSYKIMVQAAGRIDRLNTSFFDLYYYHLRSDSMIDKAISRALKSKKNFNISKYARNWASREKHMV